MTYADYRSYLDEADRRMKERNGHSYVTILKTRCQYCGKKPGAKTRCPGWFQTFANDLGFVLQEKGELKK